jgi:branched-chain amino acid transport system substrate-binding protein
MTRRPRRLSRFGKLAALCAIGAAIAANVTACSSARDQILVGALYPLTGPQGPGGDEEFHGVRLAADMTNADGGINGRDVRLVPVDAPGSDAAPAAVDGLKDRGVRIILGSYGSTISSPATAEAARQGMLFWETGAVGQMLGAGRGRLVFRVAPSGAVLGASAVSFVADHVAPALHRDPKSLRFAIANVNDLYGSWVATGAVEEIHRLGLPFAGQASYSLQGFDPTATVKRIAAMHPDVLFVSAYVADGVALRRAMVAQHLHLLANIGSSSSYCMPAFGMALGDDAVGLFASDKPDADALSIKGLSPPARALLTRADNAYHRRYHTDMSAAALAGFSAAWALFHDVMPKSSALTPSAIAAQAIRTNLPAGTLPNGSGLRFGAAGTSTAGSNVLAAGVIWEWTQEYWRGVVWPPRFATEPIRVMPIAG